MTAVTIKGLAPILLVEKVEPSLAFFTFTLGFVTGPTVPDAEPYDFAIVARDGVEIMLQTFASAGADTPAAVQGAGRAFVYLTVGDIGAVLAALAPEIEIVVPRRTTFYGADEVFIREPGGNIIGFAAFAAPIES